MTTAALVQLAEKVMGWKQRSAAGPIPHLPGGYFYAHQTDGVWYRATKWDEIHEFTPHLDPPTQALALLEAWCSVCDAGDDAREYNISRIADRTFVATLLIGGNALTWTRAATFATAATEAVCDAMCIDPEAAE